MANWDWDTADPGWGVGWGPQPPDKCSGFYHSVGVLSGWFKWIIWAVWCLVHHMVGFKPGFCPVHILGRTELLIVYGTDPSASSPRLTGNEGLESPKYRFSVTLALKPRCDILEKTVTRNGHPPQQVSLNPPLACDI